MDKAPYQNDEGCNKMDFKTNTQEIVYDCAYITTTLE